MNGSTWKQALCDLFIMLLAYAGLLFLVLLITGYARGQSAQVEVYAPEMLILKEHGRWICQQEPLEISITYPGGKMDAARVKRTIAPNIATIPATPVEGFLRKSVAPCIGQGRFSDGSEFTIWLPREPVVFSRIERIGLRWHVVMVAVPIDCPCTLVKANGETWSGSARFDFCEAHWVRYNRKLADATIAPGEMTLQRK